ncbi:hypothetical protein E0L36_19780 [Streptomyces sp. AJS327]|uniref:FAD-dependent oxidoreductase n=1 Tax=Streptomyces sp. AJS327 TaxID=2545265 RepID=UPI0015DEE44D|nr:hypothetical protein [Streptomyces sp. AJS327]MBA0053032.1 hypothetical protein [Streptomyces sp. AJS327]
MRAALVVGAGMAGLLAARVLVEHAEEVVLVERDELPDQPVVRGGAPQGAHSHILLGRGREIIGRLFPELFDRLISRGAVPLDFERDGAWFADGLRRVPVPGDDMLSMTRPLLERELRREVMELTRVRLVRGRVTGLSLSGDRVDGAWVVPGSAETVPGGGRHGHGRDGRGEGGERAAGRGDSGTVAERIAADLVVDASGRSSRLVTWLAEHGYPEPPKRRVPVDIGYATCFFHRPPGQRLDGFTAAHSVRTARAGVPGASSLNPVEGDRWMALVTGYRDNRPRRDFGDFTRRCLREPGPLRALVRECEPAGGVAVYRFPSSMRRDFHRLARFPSGLAVLGDAVASFNPVYGQGMTCGALHAEALDAWLRAAGRGGGAPDPARYLARLGRAVDDAWEMSAEQDLLLPHLRRDPSRTQRLRLRLRDRLLDGAITDVTVHRCFLDVVNMRSRPRRLMSPTVLFRALRAPRRTPVLPDEPPPPAGRPPSAEPPPPTGPRETIGPTETAAPTEPP